MTDVIKLPDEQHDWLGSMRLNALRERGWTGSALEFRVMADRLNADPIAGGFTEPAEEDRIEAERIEAGALQISDPHSDDDS